MKGGSLASKLLQPGNEPTKKGVRSETDALEMHAEGAGGKKSTPLGAGAAAGTAAIITAGTTAEIAAAAATVMAAATAAAPSPALAVVTLLTFSRIGSAAGLAAFAGS